MIADWMCCHVASTIVHVMSIVKRIFRRKRSRVNAKQIVLVCANDLLGDTLVRIPFFWTLRREFPNNKYHIVVVLSPVTYGLLSKLPCFDEVIVETVQNSSHPIFWILGRKGMAKTLAWAFRHDVGVYIVSHRYRNFGSDLVHRLCNPMISVAYVASDAYRMFPMTYKYQKTACEALYTRLFKPEVGRHQIDELNELISAAKGCNVAISMPKSRDVETMLDFSIAEQLPDNYVVLVPGARVEYRRWPIQRFIELSNLIGGRFVVVGTTDESSLAHEIYLGCKSNVYDLCGKTSLAQLGGVLMRASLVVTNETGTATFSVMLGAKTVCVLGGGDFGAFFPNRHCNTTASAFKWEPCFGCDWNCSKVDTSRTWTAPCVNAISVDDVISAARKIRDVCQ